MGGDYGNNMTRPVAKKEWRILRRGAIQVLAGRRVPSMQERRVSQTSPSRM
jgi:hypothetical protein